MSTASQTPADGLLDAPRGGRPHWSQRFSVYSDFWTRIQTRGIRDGPFFIEPILLVFYTAFFFLLCPGTRNPVISNLGVLFPESLWITNVLRSFRVFWSFANSITDAIRCREGEDIIDWEVEGDEHFRSLTSTDRGAVVLTAHMGNYDVAAPMFASQFGQKLNAVRAPERDPARQQHMREKFSAEASDDYEVHFNSGDKLLGIDLVQALMRGEYVAIQGDRVLFDVSPLQVPLEDLPGFHLNIPKGPFALALTSKVPVLPLFVLRLGRRKYKIIVRPPFPCERSSRNHDRAIQEAASRWVETLMPLVRRHWYQWYVFEQAFFPGTGRETE